MKKGVFFACVFLIVTVLFFLTGSSEVSAALTISSFDNYTINLPNQATLATLVTSTYDNSSISYNWSKVSGPGTVVFSNQYYSVTDVSFSSAGDYVLRINATDGETSDYEDVNVTVLPEIIKIQVKKSGTGSGTVSSLGEYINCGSDCSETFDEDTPISLTATPSSGSVFIGWVGSGCLGNSSSVCNVTVNGTKEVTAFFDTNTTGIKVYYVATTGNNSNNGSIDFPWLTIQHAANTAVAGDKVIITAGIYNEFITVSNSGNSTHPIVFEGERNAQGEWLTIIDPSTNASSGWEAAPEIGDGVWKKDVGLTARELTIDNKRVAFVWSMGEMSHIDVYNNVNCTTGACLLNLSTDKLVTFSPTWGSFLIRFWDGLEALWGKSGNTTYLRLRNGTNPNSMNIRVTPNQYTFFISSKNYLDFRNFKVTGIAKGFWLEYSGTHHVTIESNYLSGGYTRIDFSIGIYESKIRNNEITDNPYGYNEPGAWDPFTSTDYRYIVRQDQYLISKFIMGASASDDTAIGLYALGNNNIISGNHIFKGRGVGVQFFGPDDNPTQNTEIYDNVIENNPSIGLLISTGHNNTKIHDNLLRDNSIQIRLHNIDSGGGYNDTIYIYKNKFWLPGDAGESIKLQILNPRFWIYHNSFSGGGVGFGNGGGNEPMTNISLLNNLFSGNAFALYYGSQVGGLTDGMDICEYNFFAPLSITWFPPYPVWWGEHNLNQTEPLWGLATVPDFSLESDSIAIDAGIDLSQPFNINGTTYGPLPGMELGYFTGDAPDMGAVEYNGSGTVSLTSLFGTNPINNYNSNSSDITFDFKCSYNSSVQTIQLWTNTTGSWQANYSNSSYTNDTWLNITIQGIPEGSYKWAVYCNNSSGSGDWTNTNRTFTFTLEEEEEENDNPPGGGGGGTEENQTNVTNQTQPQPNLNNTNSNNMDNQTNVNETAGDNEKENGKGKFQLKDIIFYAAILVVVALIIIFIVLKKRKQYMPNY